MCSTFWKCAWAALTLLLSLIAMKSQVFFFCNIKSTLWPGLRICSRTVFGARASTHRTILLSITWKGLNRNDMERYCTVVPGIVCMLLAYFGFRWQSLTDGINKDKKVEVFHLDPGLPDATMRQNRSERRQRQERERDLLHQGTGESWRVASQMNQAWFFPVTEGITRNERWN